MNVHCAALSGALGDELGLLRSGRDIDRELDPSDPRDRNARVDRRVVLAGFEGHDSRLRDPEQLCECALRELVLGAVADQLGCDGSRERQPLPIGAEVLLLARRGDQGIRMSLLAAAKRCSSGVRSVRRTGVTIDQCLPTGQR